MDNRAGRKKLHVHTRSARTVGTFDAAKTVCVQCKVDTTSHQHDSLQSCHMNNTVHMYLLVLPEVCRAPYSGHPCTNQRP